MYAIADNKAEGEELFPTISKIDGCCKVVLDSRFNDIIEIN